MENTPGRKRSRKYSVMQEDWGAEKHPQTQSGEQEAFKEDSGRGGCVNYMEPSEGGIREPTEGSCGARDTQGEQAQSMEPPPKEQDVTLSPLSSPNINIELEQVQQQQELAQFEGAGTGGVAEGSSPLEVEITTPNPPSLKSIGNPPLECSYKRGFCSVHLRKGFKNIRKSKKLG